MPHADWAGVRHDLAGALEELADGEFLILGEPPSAPEPPSGFGRRQESMPARYVQALRREDVFAAECVGATSLGGTWTMTEAVIARLRRMDWLTPVESRTTYGASTPNFALYVELAAAPALAGLMVASLAVLGVEPSRLVLQGSGGGLSAVGT